MTRALCLALFLLLLTAARAGADAAPPFLLLGSTTSTRDSGLLEDLGARFYAESGIAVRVLAAGTGRALEHGRRGDVDLLLVHDRASEDAFVAAGYGLLRCDLMHNDFVLLGPQRDSARARQARDAKDALARIAERGALFLSRGDDSGTHKAERRLWRAAGLDPRARRDRWYLESGNGMGATLNMAGELRAYVLADRGTWASHAQRDALALVFEGDPLLHNPYGLLLLHPARHPRARHAHARRFAAWLLGRDGQAAINAFRRNGQQLFFASAPRAQRCLAPSAKP